MTNRKPVICFMDIETSYMLLAGFGMYDQNFTPKNIIQDWHMICASWKFQGDDKVYNVVGNGKNDKKIAKTLHDVINGSDLLVWHNGDKFDLKKMRARMIFHGLDPLRPVPTVDTLKVSRKMFGFSSHRLGYIAKFLGLIDQKGKPLDDAWLDEIKGRSGVAKAMLPYCDQDVRTLEAVYNRLKPHMLNHPSMAALIDIDERGSCNVCTSTRLTKRGFTVTKTKKKQRWQCQECGCWK